MMSCLHKNDIFGVHADINRTSLFVYTNDCENSNAREMEVIIESETR